MKHFDTSSLDYSAFRALRRTMYPHGVPKELARFFESVNTFWGNHLMLATVLFAVVIVMLTLANADSGFAVVVMGLGMAAIVVSVFLGTKRNKKYVAFARDNELRVSEFQNLPASYNGKFMTHLNVKIHNATFGHVLEPKANDPAFRLMPCTIVGDSIWRVVSKDITIYELRLDKHYHHFMVYAKIHRGWDGIVGEVPSDLHQVDLEGDFGRYFRTFCVATHEREMLTLLTPDVMAYMIDYLYDCELEIIGDRLYLYVYDMLDDTKSAYMRAFQVLDKLDYEFNRTIDRNT